MKFWFRSRSSRSSSQRSSGRIEGSSGRMEEAPGSVLEKELTATFKVFDKDGDGKISKCELGEVLRSLGDNLTDSELDVVMANLGGDDECINLQQFIHSHTEIGSTSSSESDDDSEVAALRSAFSVFDIDKNGFIIAEELQRVMRSLGDKNTTLDECRHMISSVDRDGNNMVDFSEFRCLMSGTLEVSV